MAAERVPNDRLRALIDEAGWTYEAFARAVNAVGAEAGRQLNYTRASVSHWTSGVRPRPPVPRLVAEALSRKLERPVSPAATGLTRSAPRLPEAGPGKLPDDAVEDLVEICTIDADPARRAVLRHCVYTLAALSLPGWDDLPGRLRAGAAPSDQLPGASPQVEAATLMARWFSTADAAYGGGHARGALAAYLAIDICPSLRSGSADRQELGIIAADLTYLCGFMSFDEEMHGAAERYYLAAALLAHEADDPITYAVVLRELSVQAHYLGHYNQALHLAETAVDTAAAKAGPTTRAFLHGQLAVALSAVGDRRDALSHLRTAAQQLDRGTSASGPIGVFHPASLARQDAETLVSLNDRPGAIKALQAAVHRPDSERRSRAITLARLAELQLREGYLEQACATWNQFLDDYRRIRSGRARTALETLHTEVRPYHRNPAAAALLHRALTLT